MKIVEKLVIREMSRFPKENFIP